MSSDLIKNILRILYDDIISGIYCILKSSKQITKQDLENKLREQNYSFNDLGSYIGRMVKEGFIDRNMQTIKIQPTQGERKYQKAPKIEILRLKNFSFNTLKSQYETMKKTLKADLKKREEKKYNCPKCNIEENENIASRNNFKCKNCGITLNKTSEDVSELRRKCNEIIEVLDELFKEEENNNSTGINNYYNNYLTAKFGKNFGDAGEDVFEEDNDSYI